ncbi:MAG: hypothetical protein K8S54_19685 [Spirochaetia bacterium]|nr:hypothetical protein [Spirochaetia bacterium]
MEFLVFALLNLVTGLVLYVLFSLRLQAWQDKIRTAHPLQKDVEENIRQGLQNMNEYLEEMQEVRNNFYQLLRHADELTQKLDRTPGPGGKKRPRKAASISPEPKEEPQTRPIDEEGTEHIGRILDRMKPDSVDLSTRPDSHQPRSSAPRPEQKPGAIEGLGRLAASLFGMKSFELPFREAQTNQQDVLETPRAQREQIPEPRGAEIQPSLPVHLPPAVSDGDLENKRPELNLPDESAPRETPVIEGDPHAWIRNLISSGMAAGDVSRLTGKSLAEIELIASLPQMPATPRRRRLGKTDGG